jgi:hypothetical protein
MTKELMQGLIKSLTWMIDTFKWQHDETGIPGSYSEELKAAIWQLEELESEYRQMNMLD